MLQTSIIHPRNSIFSKMTADYKKKKDAIESLAKKSTPIQADAVNPYDYNESYSSSEAVDKNTKRTGMFSSNAQRGSLFGN